MTSVELLENKRFSHIESYRVMTVNRILFSHAEVLEDVVEGFLGGDLTSGDFA